MYVSLSKAVTKNKDELRLSSPVDSLPSGLAVCSGRERNQSRFQKKDAECRGERLLPAGPSKIAILTETNRARAQDRDASKRKRCRHGFFYSNENDPQAACSWEDVEFAGRCPARVPLEQLDRSRARQDTQGKMRTKIPQTD